MDLRQLRYFVQVVESGSFSKAATVLHVAQPALSQHVKRMEDELGLQLLHRNPHGVQPTEAGGRLHVQALQILSEFTELPDRVRGEQTLPRGDVRVGLPGTVSELLAVPLIEAVRQRYPDIRIRIIEAMSGYILDWLRSGEADLAMIYATADPRGLAFHLGLSEEICLFASAGRTPLPEPLGHTVHLSDLTGLPLIVPGQGHGLRELIDTTALSSGVAIEPEIEIDSYNQIKRLVRRGVGYGVLPRMAIDQETEDGSFRIWRFDDPPITRKVYLAYSTERPLSRAQRAVGQLSWEILRGLVREKTWIASLSDETNRPSLYP
ncbi:MAG: LysR substrate-binding domain-containing protein [Rhizobiaceae bacterium]|nr:LysR substrate-binding domain-containing protein [Rhizobiaceae bacterium]